MNIVKIGGGKAMAVSSILKDIRDLGEPAIVIHGANAWRDELAGRLRIALRRLVSVSGQDSVLSDEELIDLQMMSYSGLRNKRIVEEAQKLGINAIGLTGIDGALVRAVRNPGIRILENGKQKIIRDLSGKPGEINIPLLKYLLDERYLPVVTVPFLDEKGHAVNSENDDLVALLSQSIPCRRIFFCLEAPGLLRDSRSPESLIRRICLPELREELNRSRGRIKRKLLALKRIAEGSPVELFVCDGRMDRPLIRALQGEGTWLTR